MDRTGAILREESTGLGSDVLQQPAADLADEPVGRQRRAVAHNGLAGSTGGRPATCWVDAVSDGVWLAAGKNGRMRNPLLCQQTRTFSK